MNNTQQTENKTQQAKKENILINLCFNILIPALILSKFSKPEMLGPVYGLIIALIFPLSYGIFDFIKRRKTNAISILGFVSVLLTGVIGLFQLSAEWIAIKEASVPLIIAIAILISIKTKYPLVKTFLYNEKLFDIDRINHILDENGNKETLEKRLKLSSVFLSLSFFLSSLLNFLLAKIMIRSATGTPEFNEELGHMTVLSYFVIALPCTIIMVLV